MIENVIAENDFETTADVDRFERVSTSSYDSSHDADAAGFAHNGTFNSRDFDRSSREGFTETEHTQKDLASNPRPRRTGNFTTSSAAARPRRGRQPRREPISMTR